MNGKTANSFQALFPVLSAAGKVFNGKALWCLYAGRGSARRGGRKKGRRVKKGGEVPFALFRLMRTATAGVLTGLPNRHFISTWSLGVATC